MQIKSKEEILKSKYEHFHSLQNYERSVLCNTYEDVCKLAMDEWAEQESICFAEWIVINGWYFNKIKRWSNRNETSENLIKVLVTTKTTAELYQLYKQQSKQ